VKTGHLSLMPVVSGVAGTERALASLARRDPIVR